MVVAQLLTWLLVLRIERAALGDDGGSDCGEERRMRLGPWIGLLDLDEGKKG